MSPDVCYRQRGFLLPVAVFTLVVMSAFAIGLWRSTVQTSTSISQELLTTQALYAAETGAQVAAGKLLFDTDQSQAEAECNAMPMTLTYSSDGLSQCSTNVSCSGASGVYKVVSESSCGSGDISAARTVEISVSVTGDI